MLRQLLFLSLVANVEQLISAEVLTFAEPTFDRWVYSANVTPGTRGQASTFSALPAGGTVEDRLGFFLIGFEVGQFVPPSLGASNYEVRSATLTATIGQDNLFAYDATYDSYTTYRASGTLDTDTGRPLELFGARFRNGETSLTFEEDSFYQPAGADERTAFPADASGGDVSNNVTEGFEIQPWPIGTFDTVAIGSLVPLESVATFAIDVSRSGVQQYFRDSLETGRLMLTLSSLHPATQQGGEFVFYYTRDDSVHQLFGGVAPTLSLDVVATLPLSLAGNELRWPQHHGFTYEIQSRHMDGSETWTPLTTFVATTDGEQTTNVDLSGAPKFYRVIATPTP